MNELDENISLSSLVFTSTASEEPIIDFAKIEKLNLSSQLKFIDIGVPRNISNDVKQHQSVKSFDVDDLQEYQTPFLGQFLIEQVPLLLN